MPLRSSQNFARTHYLTIKSNSSCDSYCNNTYGTSKSVNQYRCGSKTDPLAWAIHDLNSPCPANHVYMKEIQKCVYTYKNFWNSCTPPSVSFTYDGSITWLDFLNLISRLQLNDSVVSVDFDEDVVIDYSWRCQLGSTNSVSDRWRSYNSQSRSTLFGWNTNTRYILENRCLRESSYTSYSHRYAYRLCVTDAVNKFMPEDNSTHITAVNPQVKYCPTNWFDLNGRCYRISEERKTFDEAKVTCINEASSNQKDKSNDKPKIWLIDQNGNLYTGEQLNDSPKGEIVKYVSTWQARLGFFLLDTDPDHGRFEFLFN